MLGSRVLVGICVAVALVLGIALGVVIGWYAVPGAGVFLPGISESLITDGDSDISAKILYEIQAENIREYLRDLSSRPHLAGTRQDFEAAIKLKEFWRSSGLDESTVNPYDVFYSLPDPNRPNEVVLLDANSQIVHKTPGVEDILSPELRPRGIALPYYAHSAPGTVKGEIVFVNFGTGGDFRWITENATIDIRNKIILVKNGMERTAIKAQLAQHHGAVGLISYDDPADVNGGHDGKTYPDSWWMPGNAQSGSVLFMWHSDPLTPGYPATKHAYRLNTSNLDPPMLTIPVHCVGYDFARNVLQSMAGDDAPRSWWGALNVTYKLGPGFTNNKKWSVEMRIGTSSQRVITYNAFGIIRGAIEPDRYILVGNHRDKWTFGALDPNSGTAVMMELSRVMGQLVKSGEWRPRRTIIFCSWSAEEQGIIGSTEWIEEYTKILEVRAVAYANVDVAVQGNFSIAASASSSLRRLLYDAAKKVPNPNPEESDAGRSSLYDTWLETSRPNKMPRVPLLGYSSDYGSFTQLVGVPAFDIAYRFDWRKQPISIYPLYHTIFDNVDLFESFIDPDYKYSTAVCQMLGESIRALADNLILPFNLEDYATTFLSESHRLHRNYDHVLQSNGIDFNHLLMAIENFTQVAKEFHNGASNVDRHNPLAVRMINDQMMNFDKAFIDHAGLPNQQRDKNVIAQTRLFPALQQLLRNIGNSTDVTAWEEIKKHYSVVLHTIQSASSTLKGVTTFIRPSL